MMSRAVPRSKRKPWLVLAAGFLFTGALLAVPSAFSQDDGKSDPRVALRKDPHYAQLYHDAKAFFALPPAKQQAMRKLQEDLDRLAPPERESLKNVLKRYADWLDKLPPAEREAVLGTPTNHGRLQVIQEVREKEWIARQPKVIRQYLAKAPKSKPAPAVAAASTVGLLLAPPSGPASLTGAATLVAESTDLRADTIKRLKQEEAIKAHDWMIASRFWKELTEPLAKRPPLPTHAAGFSAEVEGFVREYLRPVLSKEELAQLDKAEGRWPLYPMTLVELADKHPMALPQANGPKLMSELPTEVREKVTKAYYAVAKEGKKKNADPDKYFHNAKNDFVKKVEQRLHNIPLRDPTPSIKFETAVATFAHTYKIRMPNELWPIHTSEMSVPMRVFLNDQGPFWLRLSAAEQEQLRKAEGNWPEYPLKIQEFADKHGFRVQWQALPEVGDKGDIWDRYRIKPFNKLEVFTPPAPKQKGKGLGKEAGALRLPPPGPGGMPPEFIVQALPSSSLPCHGSRQGFAKEPERRF